MELTAAQKQNLAFFKQELPNLLANNLTLRKFVVVHNQRLQHSADTFEAALKYAVDHFPINEFVVQQVIDESALVSFLSRAI